MNSQPLGSQPLTRRELREREQAALKASASADRRVRPATGRRAAATAQPVTVRRDSRSVWPAFSRPKISAPAMLAKLMTVSAMVGVAGMFVATSLPASAFQDGETATSTQALSSEVQSLDVTVAADAAPAVARDDYTVVSVAEKVRARYGNQAFAFTNNPNGTIQWPFATSVPISSGFGHRVGCAVCSSNHMGMDFAPGAGVPIQSIADGVVSEIVLGGGLGVHVIVDHVIDGQNVKSVYAHMQWGSPAVAVGQAVTVGQQLGRVGSTGNSTGAHLHLEIHVEGTPVDPFAWLKANAN